MQLSTKTLLTLLPFFLGTAYGGASGSGTTTRYWDCCKSSCSWPGKTVLAAGATPVKTCDIHDSPLADFNAQSGCTGGSAFQCSHESPWAVNDNLAYGFAAVNIGGGSEASWCCACYELTFTSGPVAGKKMVVQATNTGGDLGANHFDLSMPGGGVGIFNGCTNEWGAPSSGWGQQYGGISSRAACDSFPAALKDGCYWRFDWFKGADNPTIDFKQVACPAALTARTGCKRADEASLPAAAAGSGAAASSAAAPASSKAPAASSSSAAPVILPSTTKSTTTITVAAAPSSSTTLVVLPSPLPTTTSKAPVVPSSSAAAPVVPSSKPTTASVAPASSAAPSPKTTSSTTSSAPAVETVYEC